MGYVPEDILNSGSANNGASAGEPPPNKTDNLILSCLDTHLNIPKGLGHHRPVLDIDFEARLLPSSTPGHFHLYLDGISIPENEYMYLLTALARCGIISDGYLRYSTERGYTAVRTPGNHKPAPKPEDGTYVPKHMTRTPIIATIPPEPALIVDTDLMF